MPAVDIKYYRIIFIIMLRIMGVYLKIFDYLGSKGKVFIILKPNILEIGCFGFL